MGDDLHPGFRDVVWDFAPSPQVDDLFFVRAHSSESDLIEQEDAETGEPWRIPRGVFRTIRPGSVLRFDQGRIEEVRKLLEGALPGGLRGSLGGNDPRPVRLKVSSESLGVALLPWECLQGSLGDALVVRCVPVRFPPPPITVTPPLRVLLVTTNPKDERLLNPWEELAAIDPAHLPDYQTRVCERPTVGGLRELLGSFQPHVVHYVGHGASTAGQGHLVLHDDRDHTYWLSAAELAGLLPVCVRLLCLSTCFTAPNYDLRALARFAHAPATVKLPTTVVNQLGLERDSQPAVRRFWDVFYSQVAETGGDVTTAFARARTAIQGSPDWASFSLVLRDGTGWSLLVSDAAPAPELVRAELEALYSTSIANYMSEQAMTHPPGTKRGLEEVSQREARRASDVLSSFGGSRRSGARKR